MHHRSHDWGQGVCICGTGSAQPSPGRNLESGWNASYWNAFLFIFITKVEGVLNDSFFHFLAMVKIRARKSLKQLTIVNGRGNKFKSVELYFLC